jgi:hypothetical protein
MMKKTHFNRLVFPLALMVLMSLSCSTIKSNSKLEYTTDLVCSMKVDKSHAYSYTHKGVE